MKNLFKISFIILLIFNLNNIKAQTTNEIINKAVDWVKAGKLSDAAQYLIPLEDNIKNEDNINKFIYYTIITEWYLQNEDYELASQYLEKKSCFNFTNIDDYYTLANIYAYQTPNRYKVGKFARKAIIRIDESEKIGYDPTYTYDQICHLNYLLGIIECRYQNKAYAQQCLNLMQSLDIDNREWELKGLTEEINSLDEIENTRPIIDEFNFDRILKQKKYDSVTKDKIQYVPTLSIDSLEFMNPFNIDKYLEGIFYYEDLIQNPQDIYEAKKILENASQIILKYKEEWKSSKAICELDLRLGRLEYFLKNYNSSNIWFMLAHQNSIQLLDCQDITTQALAGIAQNYYESGDSFKAHLYGDEIIDSINDWLKITGNKINDVMISSLGIYGYILSKTHAEAFAENIFKLVIEHSPENSNNFRYACNNYGTMLFLQKREKEGLEYFEIIKEKFPDSQSISNLALAYIWNNQKDKISPILQEYIESCIADYLNYITNFNEFDWERLWEKEGPLFYLTTNYIVKNLHTPESLKLGYQATLIAKTLSFNFKSTLSNLIKEKNDSSLNYKFKEFSRLKEQFSQLSLNHKDSRLYERIKNYEDSLIHSFPNLSEALINSIPNFKSIKEALKDDDIAIEFCLYLDMLGETNYQYKYAAYILDNKMDNPEFIVLEDKMGIYEYLNNCNLDPLKISKIYSENVLYNLIWKKLDPYLKNKKRVFFSLVDQLAYVNHSILRDNDNKQIGDKYDLFRVSSTSEIPLIVSGTNQRYNSAVIYGDIEYNIEPEEVSSIDENNIYNTTFINEYSRSGWNKLPFSLTEILSIKNLLDNNDIQSIIFIGKEATEESFKNLNYSGSDIIHLATHGFSYLEDSDSTKRSIIKNMSTYSKNDIYLSWSGLLFSGVNKICKNNSEDLCLEGLENGILLAEEISRLNLQDVKLVVLSACDTAKGMIDDFGGIIGLQRAFKQAGVGSIIMSLWKVADEPTSLLMTYFYEELLSGKERHEALKIAQDKVRELYPDPYYWAAFVILD